MGGLFLNNPFCRGLDIYLLNRPQELADLYLYSFHSNTYLENYALFSKKTYMIVPKILGMFFKLGLLYLAYCSGLRYRSPA